MSVYIFCHFPLDCLYFHFDFGSFFIYSRDNFLLHVWLINIFSSLELIFSHSKQGFSQAKFQLINFFLIMLLLSNLYTLCLALMFYPTFFLKVL